MKTPRRRRRFEETSKIQIPSSREAPSTNYQTRLAWEIRIWRVADINQIRLLSGTFIPENRLHILRATQYARDFYRALLAPVDDEITSHVPEPQRF